jgi:hypothetical protein
VWPVHKAGDGIAGQIAGEYIKMKNPFAVSCIGAGQKQFSNLAALFGMVSAALDAPMRSARDTASCLIEHDGLERSLFEYCTNMSTANAAIRGQFRKWAAQYSEFCTKKSGPRICAQNSRRPNASRANGFGKPKSHEFKICRCKIPYYPSSRAFCLPVDLGSVQIAACAIPLANLPPPRAERSQRPVQTPYAIDCRLSRNPHSDSILGFPAALKWPAVYAGRSADKQSSICGIRFRATS